MFSISSRHFSSLLYILILSFFLFSSFQLALGQGDDEVEFMSGFEVEFDDDEPQWEFEINQNDEEYELTVKNIFELSIANGAISQVPIPVAFNSFTWTQTSSSSYYETTTSSAPSSFSSLSFKTLYPSTTNTSTVINLGFTLTLNGYQWTSTDPNAKLVIVYELVSDGHRQSENYNYANSSFPNTLLLNNVFLGFSPAAQSSSGLLTIQTAFSSEEFWVIYPHFTGGQLTHSASFGFLNAEPYEHDDDHGGGDGGSKGWIAAVVIVPIVVVVALGVFVWWRRRGSSSSSSGRGYEVA